VDGEAVMPFSPEQYASSSTANKKLKTARNIIHRN
jgi:hypothetical protein